MKTYKLKLSKTYHFGLWFEKIETLERMSFIRYFKTIKETREYVDSINYDEKMLKPRLFDYEEMKYCSKKLYQ